MRVLSLAIGVALLLPTVADAKPRVALAPIEGDSNGAIEDMVAELLDGDYSVSGPSQVRRKIDQLGLDEKMSEKDLKKLANELDAEAIVRGDVSSSGKHKVLHVRLFVNGKRVKGFKVEFASTRSEKVKSALKDKLLEKLGGGSTDAVEEKPVKKKKAADEETTSDDAGAADETPVKKKTDDAASDDAGSDEKPTKRKKTADDASADDADDPMAGKKSKKTASADEDDEEVSASFTPSHGGASELHSANRAAVRVDFGPSASSRSLTFTSRNFEQAPKPYKNAIVPGGRIAGDIYPLAFGNPNGIAAGIGVGGNYDKTIGLKLRSTAQLGTQFPVDQSHWSIGLRFRIAFGSKPTSPTVTLRGGLFHRKFEVDRSELQMGNVIDLPDVMYVGYDPGVDMRFPLGTKYVSLILGGEAYLVTNTGGIQKLDSYGQARVTGGEGYGGLDISVTSRVAVRLVGEASQLGFAFTGNGEQANNRDGDPTTKDVGGAADRTVGGSLTVGVVY